LGHEHAQVNAIGALERCVQDWGDGLLQPT